MKACGGFSLFASLCLVPILKKIKKKKENTRNWAQHSGPRPLQSHELCAQLMHPHFQTESVFCPQPDDPTWGQGTDGADTKGFLLSCTRAYGSATRPSACPPHAFCPILSGTILRSSLFPSCMKIQTTGCGAHPPCGKMWSFAERRAHRLDTSCQSFFFSRPSTMLSSTRQQ